MDAPSLPTGASTIGHSVADGDAASLQFQVFIPPTEAAMCAGRLYMKLLALVVLLLALEGCQGSGRFEAPPIGPFAVSKWVTVV
jgi:hypothetical protein